MAARTILPGFLLVLAAAGCGGSVGQVSGTVTYAGRPLSDGTVVLLASDGCAHDAPISPDGRFTLTDVATGEARVCVTSVARRATHAPRSVARATLRRADPQADSVSRIPTHYGDLARSKLSVTVTENTTLDLNLR